MADAELKGYCRTMKCGPAKIGGFVAAMLAAPALAQRANVEREMAEQERDRASGLSFTISPSARYTFESDMDAGGEVSVFRTGLGFSMGGPIGDKGARWGFLAGGEYSKYDFSGTAFVPGGADPFDDMWIATFGPQLIVPIGDGPWSLYGSVVLRFAGEDDALFDSDSMTVRGLAGARYEFSEDFALTVGAFVTTQIEDDVRVFPLVRVEWQITDKLRLDTGGIEARGPGVSLTYSFTDAWSLALIGAYESRDYRLDDDNAALPSGVIRDTRVPISLELAYRPSRQVELAVEGGVIAWQEFEVGDSTGLNLGDDETDLTPFIGLRASFRF